MRFWRSLETKRDAQIAMYAMRRVRGVDWRAEPALIFGVGVVDAT